MLIRIVRGRCRWKNNAPRKMERQGFQKHLIRFR